MNPRRPEDQAGERRRLALEAIVALTARLHDPANAEDVVEEIARGARTLVGGEVAALLWVRDQVPTIVAVDGPGERDLPAMLAAVEDEVVSLLTDGREMSVVQGAGRVLVLAPLHAVLAEPRLIVASLPEHAGADPAPGVDEEIAELLGMFVEQAGLAIDRTVALAERQELMLVAERDRIARDLHDVVIQRLFATGLQLQGVRGKVDDPAVTELLASAVKDLDTTIRDIRTTIFELQYRGRVSLRADVRKLVREYVPVLGFTPLVRITGAVDALVPDPVAAQLLAVLREALSNVARHAGATTCRVEVDVRRDEAPGRVRLAVIDNGTGIDGEVVESGLRNARRRAQDLGGTLTHAGEEAGGTRLVWQVPLAP
ncbi:histidine kinase [Nocardioides sp. AE5]|uniref:sensor histidine kinase n=1 Tax=Nocardioides sp. AE5 TaxID=2962573 RepID=UPI002881DD48|nr:histidine kinase [Nocardioides sp. AE5]MDT0200781.1 histidine kinase [Nocardioides sp. AE5]